MPLPKLYGTTTKTLKRTTKRHSEESRYCAVFWVEGKIQRVWLGYVSEKDAKSLLEPAKAERIREIRLAQGADEITPEPSPAERTLVEAQRKHLEERAPRLRPSTIVGYKDQDANALAFFGEKVLLADITRSKVEAWVRERLKKVKAATVNRDLSRLRSVLRWATDEEWLERNPMAKVRQLDEGDGEYDAEITEDQVERLAKVCPLWLWRILLFALLTGFRLGEILGLEWTQIRGGLIHLRGSDVKGKRSATFPIEPEVQEILNIQAEERPSGSPYVFNGERLKTKLNKSWVSKIWRAVRIEAGMEKTKIHHFRHAFCSWLLQQGVPLEVIQELARHRSFVTTKRYAKLKPEHQRRALQQHPARTNRHLKPTPQEPTPL